MEGDDLSDKDKLSFLKAKTEKVEMQFLKAKFEKVEMQLKKVQGASWTG